MSVDVESCVPYMAPVSDAELDYVQAPQRGQVAIAQRLQMNLHYMKEQIPQLVLHMTMLPDRTRSLCAEHTLMYLSEYLSSTGINALSKTSVPSETVLNDAISSTHRLYVFLVQSGYSGQFFEELVSVCLSRPVDNDVLGVMLMNHQYETRIGTTYGEWVAFLHDLRGVIPRVADELKKMMEEDALREEEWKKQHFPQNVRVLARMHRPVEIFFVMYSRWLTMCLESTSSDLGEWQKQMLDSGGLGPIQMGVPRPVFVEISSPKPRTNFYLGLDDPISFIGAVKPSTVMTYMDLLVKYLETIISPLTAYALYAHLHSLEAWRNGDCSQVFSDMSIAATAYFSKKLADNLKSMAVSFTSSPYRPDRGIVTQRDRGNVSRFAELWYSVTETLSMRHLTTNQNSAVARGFLVASVLGKDYLVIRSVLNYYRRVPIVRPPVVIDTRSPDAAKCARLEKMDDLYLETSFCDTVYGTHYQNLLTMINSAHSDWQSKDTKRRKLRTDGFFRNMTRLVLHLDVKSCLLLATRCGIERHMAMRSGSKEPGG